VKSRFPGVDFVIEENITEGLLQQQGYAVFEYLGEGTLQAIGKPAAWCREIFGDEAANGNPIQISGEFPFLEDFLDEVEPHWDFNGEGGEASGAWLETSPSGQEIALEASALSLGGRRILAIQNPQKRYEEQLQVLQRGRTSLLEHERLQKEIQKKEILLHCIVHDLFQPLTSMRASFSLLAQAEMPPELKEVLEIAERQSENQETMIRGILEAFSADLKAQQAIEKDTAKLPDLARCSQKTAEAFMGPYLQHGARIEADPHLDLSRDWRVGGDEPRVLRIFGNLAENALRHTPVGGTVTLGVIDEDRFLRAFVDDQGPGLPEDQSSTELFALFAKGKGNRGGKAGLGLYFCKMTVERWGGSIGCETRPTGGARFWFRLPRA
jgi:signal transduction histidine kinase